MRQSIQEWTKQNCGRQPLKNLKGYGLFWGMLCKSLDWFLYDRDLRHERVNLIFPIVYLCMDFHDLCKKLVNICNHLLQNVPK